ncbi:MAG TPA: hypothetical protein VHT04_11435 [Stellaceae bacterium]|nr:hypothetical protein [Stellaceae bacterium]
MPTTPVEILTGKESVAATKRRATLDRWIGRPSAAQRRLLDALFATMVEDFEKHGPKTIAIVRNKDPVNYLRLMIALVRKPLSDLETERLFSNDDVADALARLDQIAARFSLDFRQVDEGTDDSLPAFGLPGLPEAE